MPHPLWDEPWVYWKNSDHEHHSMPFALTDEGINAVIIAMKLTC